ncbi:MAG: SurA N-terminal domain-containing protein [Nitrospirae bacterium]|nr:SurA N-terminal domain-containing protein [Nitrospirota bacterium]
MKIGIIYVIVLLLSAGTLSDSASASPEAQDEKAPAAEQKVKQIGLGEARKVVAARVNGTDIMLDAVMILSDRLNLQMRQAHSAEGPSAAMIQKEALERVIVQELAYQRAKARDIAAEPKAVDSALADIKARAGGEEAYRNFLAQNEMTEDQMRTQVEKGLIIETAYKQDVLDKISVAHEV